MRNNVVVFCSRCGDPRTLKTKYDRANWKRSTLKRCIKCRSITHGNTVKNKQTNTYMVWGAMVQRATNPNNKQSADYMGRGIGISDTWLFFANFLKDMGEQPKGLTIERRDNDKGYCKENCYWATRETQAQNKRHFKLTKEDVLEIRALFGTMKQKDIAVKFNVSATTICEIKKGNTHAK